MSDEPSTSMVTAKENVTNSTVPLPLEVIDPRKYEEADKLILLEDKLNATKTQCVQLMCENFELNNLVKYMEKIFRLPLAKSKKLENALKLTEINV